MNEPWDNSRCCCKREDSNACYEYRYPAPIDDVARSFWYEEMQDGDSYCECACHDIPHDYDEAQTDE